MIEESDMLSIHDRLHFCKDTVGRWSEFKMPIRVCYDDPIKYKDNGNYDLSWKRENDDLADFYNSAALFMDALIADKIRYCLGPSFCAKDTFSLIIRGHDDEQARDRGQVVPVARPTQAMKQFDQPPRQVCEECGEELVYTWMHSGRAMYHVGRCMRCNPEPPVLIQGDA